MKLNFADFKENKLTRIQTSNIIGGAPVIPLPTPPLLDAYEDGDPIKTTNNGDPRP